MVRSNLPEVDAPDVTLARAVRLFPPVYECEGGVEDELDSGGAASEIGLEGAYSPPSSPSYLVLTRFSG